MNDIELTQNLQKVAKLLDEKGHFKQADRIAQMLVKLAQEEEFSVESELAKFKKDTESEEIYLQKGENYIKVPETLQDKILFSKDNIEYILSYNDIDKFFYFNPKGKPSTLKIDTEGKVIDPRPKKVDLLRELRLPKLRLPKVTNVETWIRKKAIPEAAKVIRPIGDQFRPVSRAVTDVIGPAGESIGITDPTSLRSVPGFKAVREEIGQSDDRGPGTVSEPKPLFVKKPRARREYLKDINSGQDLTFWAMSEALDVPYEQYTQELDYRYYSEENRDRIKKQINLMTSNPFYLKENNRLPNFKEQALFVLDKKIQDGKAKIPKTTKSTDIPISDEVPSISAPIPPAQPAPEITPSQMGGPYGGEYNE